MIVHMSTTAMSAQDSLWLTMDRPNNLMVVDGAVVLAGVPAIDTVQRAFDVAVDRFPVLRSRATNTGSGWTWVLDEDFFIGNHVKALTLDGRADMSSLQEFVAVQRSQALNRERPLWQAYLVGPIELPDGTVGSAVVTRFHHAIADGVRLTQLLLGLCDPVGDPSVPDVGRDPNSAPSSVPGVTSALGASADIAVVTAEAARQALGSAFGTMSGLAGAVAGQARQAASDPVAAVVGMPSALAAAPGRAWSSAVDVTQASLDRVDEGLHLIRNPDQLLDALSELGVAESRPMNTLASVTKLFLTEGESTVWTGKPGTTKKVAWSTPMPLDVVKQIGRQFDATVNDVLLAVLAGALRRYLDERGGRINEAVWLVPVNMKPFDVTLPEDLGNYFALVMLSMPIQQVAPAARLADIHGRMQRIKHSDEPVFTFGLQRSMSFSPAAVGVFMTNFFANKSVGVLTNVPGPTGPMTFAQVLVTQVIGFAPCSGDQPMTATIFSYDGGVTMGFATDADLIPDPERLVELVLAEFEVFRNLG